MITFEEMSRSPVAASFRNTRRIVSVYVPAGTMIISVPASALASWMAARSVQTPPAVAQMPSPGVASTASSVLLTENVAACATDGARITARPANRHANVGFFMRGDFVLVVPQILRAGGADDAEQHRDERLTRRCWWIIHTPGTRCASCSRIDLRRVAQSSVPLIGSMFD